MDGPRTADEQAGADDPAERYHRHMARLQRMGEARRRQIDRFGHAANSLLKPATAAAGPSAWFHTPAETARKSAPAAIRGGAFSIVMPPMATEGTSINSLHQDNRSISARLGASLVVVG